MLTEDDVVQSRQPKTLDHQFLHFSQDIYDVDSDSSESAIVEPELTCWAVEKPRVENKTVELPELNFGNPKFHRLESKRTSCWIEDIEVITVAAIQSVLKLKLMEDLVLQNWWFLESSVVGRDLDPYLIFCVWNYFRNWRGQRITNLQLRLNPHEWNIHHQICTFDKKL